MANLHAPWTFSQGDQDNRNNGIVYDSRGYILNRRAVMNEDDRAAMVVSAAAPDMLAALKAIFEPQPYSATQEWRDNVKRAREMALAAIAKAEGRA